MDFDFKILHFHVGKVVRLELIISEHGGVGKGNGSIHDGKQSDVIECRHFEETIVIKRIPATNIA